MNKPPIYADGWSCKKCGGSVITPFEEELDVTSWADNIQQRLMVTLFKCAGCGASVPHDIGQWHFSQDQRLLSVEECLKILSQPVARPHDA